MTQRTIAIVAFSILVAAASPAESQTPPRRAADTRAEAASVSGTFIGQHLQLLKDSRRPGEAGDAAREELQRMKDEGHPLVNPDHPGRDHKKDPGGPLPMDYGGPPTITARADWPWGELYFDNRYPTKIVVENQCWTAEKVGIFVTDLPYITLPAELVIPPRGRRELTFEIVTPAEPTPPLAPPTGFPPGFSWGWQKPPAIPSPQPYDPNRPRWHQPNFIDVAGQVVIWHPWTPNPECKPKREVYTVSGHIHFRPPDEGGPPSGPQEIFEADPCDVWWLTGERPAQLEHGDVADTDCTDRIRQLAADFVERILAPYIEADRGAWSWLPAADRIHEMSIGELLAMKARADAQALGNGEGGS